MVIPQKVKEFYLLNVVFIMIFLIFILNNILFYSVCMGKSRNYE